MGELIDFIPHHVNGVKVDQRNTDGFINGTAMCTAHGKEIKFWLHNKKTLEFFISISAKMGIKSYVGKLPYSADTKLSASDYVEIFPHLITTKGGSPEFGGGSWVHPNIAVFLAQWCNTPFAVEVTYWIIEWFSTGKNPVHPNSDPDQEYIAWQERYDIRIELKDVLRPELMEVTRAYAETNKLNAYNLCWQVHDTMNHRIQGAKAKDIRNLNGLPLSDLLRDYFDTKPLHVYAAINRIAINKIIDSNVEPIEAVHQACDVYLGAKYIPKLVSKVENLYIAGRRIKKARELKAASSNYTQLSLFPGNEAV